MTGSAQHATSSLRVHHTDAARLWLVTLRHGPASMLSPVCPMYSTPYCTVMRSAFPPWGPGKPEVQGIQVLGLWLNKHHTSAPPMVDCACSVCGGSFALLACIGSLPCNIQHEPTDWTINSRQARLRGTVASFAVLQEKPHAGQVPAAEATSPPSL